MLHRPSPPASTQTRLSALCSDAEVHILGARRNYLVPVMFFRGDRWKGVTQFWLSTTLLHTCVPISDTSQGLVEEAIYSPTTGTYAFEWNAVQNAKNIFSSCQQTAEGTSGSSPCLRAVISVTAWAFNYCNLLFDSCRNIRPPFLW